MSKKMRRICFLMIAILMLTTIVLTGCKAEEESEATKAPAKEATKTEAPKVEEEPEEVAPEPIEIRATFWSSAVRDVMYGGIIDRFMVAYPHVTVKVEGLGWGDYWDKLTVQSASQNEADFVAMHPRYASDFVLRGVLEPLQPFIDEGTIDLSEWDQPAIDAGKVDGVQYLIPMGLTVQSFFINTPMLNQYGVTIPSERWTWDDIKTIGLEAVAAFEAAGDEVYFINDYVGDNLVFGLWARGLGEEMYTEDATIGFSEQTLIDYWTYWVELEEANICPPPEMVVEFQGTDHQTSDWAAGLIAVRRTPPNQIEQWTKFNPYGEELILGDQPIHAGSSFSSDYVSFGSYSVSAKSPADKQLAAAQLLNFWVGTEESYELYGIDQGVPGNKKMVEYLKNILNPQQTQMVEYVAKASARTTVRPFDPAGQSEFQSEFQLVGEQIMFGRLTPEEAAADFMVNAAKILADAQKS